MRLITHNLLCCNTKTCRGGEQSLGLAVERSEIRPKEFDAATVVRMVGHLDWTILGHLAHQVRLRLTAVARRNELPSCLLR